MGETTGISWTDHTFNPWWGCTKVSPGCDNCYAEALDKRRGFAHWGAGAPRRVMSDHYWNEPLRWDRAHAKAGTMGKVFCASMADVMDDEIPEGQRERLWGLIDRTPNLIWQLLTKRPHRYEKHLPDSFRGSPRVWLGTTAENQKFYDVRWPQLAHAAGKFDLLTWISYEPALGPLTLRSFPVWPRWVIFGGESGPHRRSCDEQWARDLREEIHIYLGPWASQCALFVKQMSGLTPAAGKALIPADLQIQEFPCSSI